MPEINTNNSKLKTILKCILSIEINLLSIHFLYVLLILKANQLSTFFSTRDMLLYLFGSLGISLLVSIPLIIYEIRKLRFISNNKFQIITSTIITYGVLLFALFSYARTLSDFGPTIVIVYGIPILGVLLILNSVLFPILNFISKKNIEKGVLLITNVVIILIMIYNTIL